MIRRDGQVDNRVHLTRHGSGSAVTCAPCGIARDFDSPHQAWVFMQAHAVTPEHLAHHADEASAS